MSNTCPACQSDNQPNAVFCEQCGVALSKPTAATATTPVVGGRSPLAIMLMVFAIFAVVALMIWVIDRSSQSALESGTEVLAASPHGEPGQTAGMDSVSELLEAGKARLDANPLDVPALNELYDMYGKVGQLDKVTPYTEAAVAAWRAASGTEAGSIAVLAGLAMAAMDHNDARGAVTAMTAYQEAQPDNHAVIGSLGNLYFELSRDPKAEPAAVRQAAASSVDWYDRYLATFTDEEPDREYWNTLVDQASMLLVLADADPAKPEFQRAIASLEQVTVGDPANWSGWHNLGLAHGLGGQNPQAILALSKAMEVTQNKMNRWESEKQIALLEGKPLPPSPFEGQDPHAGLDLESLRKSGGKPGMGNPHGEGSMPNPHGKGAKPNPHGEDDKSNPHGKNDKPNPPGKGKAPNPHGGQDT